MSIYHDERCEDPDFLRLISYPRTGSHWFRIIIEMYSNRPSMVETFFNSDWEGVWGYHMHNRYVDKAHNEPGFGKGNGDIRLYNTLNNVIYLSRNPVDVIYSQLKYDDNFDEENYKDVSEEYLKHLDFWKNEATAEKIIYVDYDDLKNDPHETFKKVFKFIGGIKYNSLKLDKTLRKCTKEKTQFLTTSNGRVMCEEQLLDNTSYEKHKKEWSDEKSDEIIEMFKGVYYE